jgi:hypothetical protein
MVKEDSCGSLVTLRVLDVPNQWSEINYRGVPQF